MEVSLALRREKHPQFFVTARTTILADDELLIPLKA
ncbi:hypothetical protein T4B_7707 [Trichinella pseudospiralis]|uniref:Uncharacterized protein n=2 Tax=Trichinella pseudospiralis TaxID=6337 RepID=A0A0V0XSB6_TRIPS|nr:hypothetical protein T4E_8734 [Trichinella pseudospiralis]KRY83080.1 hypothetical protein T4D_14351 [Trichinella pseudospiralis]KRZ22616.1 hypothetical protein T4B_7707 [Trichinella pseudospiralis]